jgi:hypothetical protein
MYQIVKVLNDFVITRKDEDGKIWCIPEVESNSDYQQYLVDTDGGLPIPKEGK